VSRHSERMDKIREAGAEELQAQQKELTEQVFRLRFQLSTGQAEAVKRLRDAKKDLARIKTLLRARELTATPRRPKTSAAYRAVKTETAERLANAGASRPAKKRIA
jgi:large subunit ribosomal protein L29